MKLGSIKAETFAKFVSVASDIALILDKDGVVEDVSVRKTDLAALGCQSWIGRPWISTVTSECRGKIEDMLSPKSGNEEVRWRHINHPSSQGIDVPVQYAVIGLEDAGRMLALGRDMEGIAVLQRRLIETQQSIERDYLRLRFVEARYRILFDTTREAVMVVDGSTYRVIDANSSAQAFARDANRKLAGRDFLECFEPYCAEELQSLLRMAHATGRIEMCKARFGGATIDCTVSATAFRQESGSQFMVRLLSQESVAYPTLTSNQQLLFSEAMVHSPMGFVLTDRSGDIKSANDEFLLMVGATSLSQLYGQGLENWLARGGIDWGVLLTNLRAQAKVTEFTTELRAMSGTLMAVEISASTLTKDETYYAFYIRDVERRRVLNSPASSSMEGSVAELSHLVGRMPMKDIVGETVDMLEKMCIQSALQLTNNNRASAAEMLGLSRQSLYVKLRRFHMVNDNPAEDID